MTVPQDAAFLMTILLSSIVFRAPTLAPLTDRGLYLDGEQDAGGSLRYLKELDFGDKLVAVVSDRNSTDETHAYEPLFQCRYDADESGTMDGAGLL